MKVSGLWILIFLFFVFTFLDKEKRVLTYFFPKVLPKFQTYIDSLSQVEKFRINEEEKHLIFNILYNALFSLSYSKQCLETVPRLFATTRTVGICFFQVIIESTLVHCTMYNVHTVHVLLLPDWLIVVVCIIWEPSWYPQSFLKLQDSYKLGVWPTGSL